MNFVSHLLQLVGGSKPRTYVYASERTNLLFKESFVVCFFKFKHTSFTSPYSETVLWSKTCSKAIVIYRWYSQKIARGHQINVSNQCNIIILSIIKLWFKNCLILLISSCTMHVLYFCLNCDDVNMAVYHNKCLSVISLYISWIIDKYVDCGCMLFIHLLHYLNKLICIWSWIWIYYRWELES